MRWGALLLTLLLTVSSGWGRTFLSSDGKRAIRATLLDYDPEEQAVKIRRHDGKVFTNALSMYSRADQTYILRWNDGKRENYAIYGREYPGQLQLYMKLLEAGNIGYGQTIIYGPTHAPIIIGNGGTPFLAFVNGYNMLGVRNQRANVAGVTFTLQKKNWQARIGLQSMRSSVTSVGTPMVVGTNMTTMFRSVSGPILYQQPNNIVIVNPPAFGAPVIMMPRQPSPVFVNPFGGGVMLNGVTMGGGGFIGSSNSFSRGGGISVRISR